MSVWVSTMIPSSGTMARTTPWTSCHSRSGPPHASACPDCASADRPARRHSCQPTTAIATTSTTLTMAAAFQTLMSVHVLVRERRVRLLFVQLLDLRDQSFGIAHGLRPARPARADVAAAVDQELGVR